MTLSIKHTSKLAGFILLSLVMLVLNVPLTTGIAHADGTCSVTNWNPTSAPGGSTTGIAITVSDSATDLAYVHVAMSDANGSSIVNANSDWYGTVTNDATSATYSGTPITVGNDPQVSISVAFASSMTNYTVHYDVTVSGSADGSGAYSCGSTQSVDVSADTPPPPVCATSTDITCRDIKLASLGLAGFIGWMTIKQFRWRHHE